jgi:type II secretory pathway component GspD/PulD (secretin)
MLETVLVRAPEWLAVERTISKAPVVIDPNADSKAPWPAWAKRGGLETVILRGSLEQVEAACKLVEATLSSVPQILIEARVVEVVESDEFGLGIDMFLLEHDDHGPLDPTAGPLQPLDPSKTVFDRGLLGAGIPPLPGIVSSGLLPNALVELGTLKDGIQVDLLIAALSQLTKIDVVNAPNVAVRAGHIATISAGEEVPYFTVNVSGSNQTVSTQFKKVAVNLSVLPTLTSHDRLSMAVDLRVENVTGITTVDTGGAATSNPIISSRHITTTMDCKDGATVVLGGLIQTRDISVDEKVPLLGDIPILGYLFKSIHSQEARSNLLFFLRPKIINPSSSKDTEIILPPSDDQLIGPGGDQRVIKPPKPGGGKDDESQGSTGSHG